MDRTLYVAFENGTFKIEVTTRTQDIYWRETRNGTYVGPRQGPFLTYDGVIDDATTKLTARANTRTE